MSFFESPEQFVERYKSGMVTRINEQLKEKKSIVEIYHSEMSKLQELQNNIIEPPSNIHKTNRYRNKRIQALGRIVNEYKNYFSSKIDDRLNKAELFAAKLRSEENAGRNEFYLNTKSEDGSDVIGDTTVTRKSFIDSIKKNELSESERGLLQRDEITNPVGTSENPTVFKVANNVSWLIYENKYDQKKVDENKVDENKVDENKVDKNVDNKNKENKREVNCSLLEGAVYNEIFEPLKNISPVKLEAKPNFKSTLHEKLNDLSLSQHFLSLQTCMIWLSDDGEKKSIGAELINLAKEIGFDNDKSNPINGILIKKNNDFGVSGLEFMAYKHPKLLIEVMADHLCRKLSDICSGSIEKAEDITKLNKDEHIKLLATRLALSSITCQLSGKIIQEKLLHEYSLCNAQAELESELEAMGSRQNSSVFKAANTVKEILAGKDFEYDAEGKISLLDGNVYEEICNPLKTIVPSSLDTKQDPKSTLHNNLLKKDTLFTSLQDCIDKLGDKNSATRLIRLAKGIKFDNPKSKPINEILIKEDNGFGVSGLEFMAYKHPKILIEVMADHICRELSDICSDSIKRDEDITKLNKDEYVKLMTTRQALSNVTCELSEEIPGKLLHEYSLCNAQAELESELEAMGTRQNPSVFKTANTVKKILASKDFENNVEGKISLLTGAVYEEICKPLKKIVPSSLDTKQDPNSALHSNFTEKGTLFTSLPDCINNLDGEKTATTLISLAKKVGFDKDQNNPINEILIKKDNGFDVSGLEFMANKHPKLLIEVMAEHMCRELSDICSDSIKKAKDITQLNKDEYIKLLATQQALSSVTCKLSGEIQEKLLHEYCLYNAPAGLEAELKAMAREIYIQGKDDVEWPFPIIQDDPLPKEYLDGKVDDQKKSNSEEIAAAKKELQKKLNLQLPEATDVKWKRGINNSITVKENVSELYHFINRRRGLILLPHLFDKHFDKIKIAKGEYDNEKTGGLEKEILKANETANQINPQAEKKNIVHHSNKIEIKKGKYGIIDEKRNILEKQILNNQAKYEFLSYDEAERRKARGEKWDNEIAESKELERKIEEEIKEFGRLNRIDKLRKTNHEEELEKLKKLNGLNDLNGSIKHTKNSMPMGENHENFDHFRDKVELGVNYNGVDLLALDRLVKANRRQQALKPIEDRSRRRLLLYMEGTKEALTYFKMEKGLRIEQDNNYLKELATKIETEMAKLKMNDTIYDGVSAEIWDRLKIFITFCKTEDFQIRLGLMETIFAIRNDFCLNVHGMDDLSYLVYSGINLDEESEDKIKDSKSGLGFLCENYPKFLASLTLLTLSKNVSGEMNGKVRDEIKKLMDKVSLTREFLPFSRIAEKKLDKLIPEQYKKEHLAAIGNPNTFANYQLWQNMVALKKRNLYAMIDVQEEDLLTLFTNDVTKLTKLSEKYSNDECLKKYVQYRTENLAKIQTAKEQNSSASSSRNGFGKTKEFVLSWSKKFCMGDNVVYKACSDFEHHFNKDCRKDQEWAIVLADMLSFMGMHLSPAEIESYLAPHLMDEHKEEDKVLCAQDMELATNISDHMNLISYVLPNAALHKLIIKNKGNGTKGLEELFRKQIKRALAIDQAPLVYYCDNNYKIIMDRNDLNIGYKIPSSNDTQKTTFNNLEREFLNQIADDKEVNFYWLTDVGKEFESSCKNSGGAVVEKCGKNGISIKTIPVPHEYRDKYQHENYHEFMLSYTNTPIPDQVKDFIYLPKRSYANI